MCEGLQHDMSRALAVALLHCLVLRSSQRADIFSSAYGTLASGCRLHKAPCSLHKQLPSLSCPCGVLDVADARSVVSQARQQAAEFRFTYGYEVPVDYLAKVLADKAQVYTQVGTRRVVGAGGP